MINTEPQVGDAELDRREILEKFIREGLTLIKEGSYKEAITHFENREMADTLGFHYEVSPLEAVVRKPITQIEEIKGVVDFCAVNSYFDFGFKAQGTKPQIALSSMYFPEQILGSIKPEIMTRLLHNVALIHAEEWIHSLQKEKGPLAGSVDGDIDVALFLFNHGVPQTDEFLARNGRAEVINGLK